MKIKRNDLQVRTKDRTNLLKDPNDSRIYKNQSHRNCMCRKRQVLSSEDSETKKVKPNIKTFSKKVRHPRIIQKNNKTHSIQIWLILKTSENWRVKKETISDAINF